MVVTEEPTGCSSLTVQGYMAGTVTITNRHLQAQLFAFDRDVNSGADQLCNPDGTCPPNGDCPGSNSVTLDISADSYASGTETSMETCGACTATVPLPAYRFHIDSAAQQASFNLNLGDVVLTKQ